MTNSIVTSLVDQLDWHWSKQLRPRLAGLTDDEYFWAPVPDCWSVHPDGSIDFSYPPPDPEPVTTISWRLGHVIVGVLAVRAYNHFGGPQADYQTWNWATDANTALRQLDGAYGDWITGVRGLDEQTLDRPIGPAEGQWADKPMIDLVLHISREVIHHGAEIALLRDLYAHTYKEN
jgi:DinB superfamily